MKFAAPLFAATTVALASAQTDSQRKLATLAQKWNLTEPSFAFDANTFSLTFPVTDYINTGMAQYSLWTAPDCAEGGESLDESTIWAANSLAENAALLAADGFDPDVPASYTMLDSGVFSGREATVNAEIDPQTISASNIYEEAVVNNQMTATIRFCIRFGLWTTEALGVTTPVEVNFLETLVTLTVDLTDGFEIGAINVAPKDRLVRTANQAYEVRGYECSQSSTAPLSEVDRARPRNQGEIIHICVTPEDEAKTDGIFMRSIDDFTFNRGGTIQQVAIDGGNEAANLLTTYNSAACLGAEFCRFSTILFAQFYATPGAVNGAGVASMQFGDGTGRRALRASSGRDLQGDGAGAAEFDLQFDVAQAEARTQSSGATSSTSIAAGAMSLVAIAAAMI